MKVKLPVNTLYFLFIILIFSAACAQETTVLDSIRAQDTVQSALDEVVISASRTNESILKSPVSIENVTTTYFNKSASPSFFDALENVKGVQMLTPSLGFKIINTRGFANTTNVRFVQMVDGFDNQAPHIGAPIGNALGPTDLDIEKVEIIPGTASALYGLNAINGLANFITKNPFESEGITFQQKTGVNHLGGNGSKPKLFTEYTFRVAKKLSEHFAVKVNGSFTKGYDWVANDHNDLNAGANSGVGIEVGTVNPAYDPVNGYGNESSNRRTLTLQGTRYVVARTGYSEQDVTDYAIRNIKSDIGLYYKLADKTMLVYTYRFASIDNVYQRANRFALKDYRLQQHAVELKNDTYQLRAFATGEDTGSSYNLRSAAENLDRRFKTDDQWYADFASSFNASAAQPGYNVQQALNNARSNADQGRLQPGTPAFKQALNELADINDWDRGAALRVKDWLVHAEGQVNITRALGKSFLSTAGVEVLGGIDYHAYIINPDGNYFINPISSDAFQTFIYGKTGGFIQATANLFRGFLKLSATLRADKNDYFTTKYNPRLAAVLTPAPNHSIRASIQSGSRFPSIFEAYSNVNSGGVRRVGGLKVMSDGVFENAYLRSSIDRFQAAVTNEFNNGASLDEAIENQKGLLVKNYYTYLKPEQINSFEAGYKSFLFNRNLKVDADFYFNRYKNFIAQIEMNVPNSTVSDSIPYYLNDRSRQSRYRIYTNSRSVVFNYGVSLGLGFQLTENYQVSGNVSYAKLSRTNNGDGFEDGFNTPEWIGNITMMGEHLFKRFGFAITYRRQTGFYWRSFLVNGEVDAFGTLDGQLNCSLYNATFLIKLGATNMLDKYYNSFLGGPSVGGFYYTTLTYTLL